MDNAQVKLIGVRCMQEERQVGVLLAEHGEVITLSPKECWARYRPETERYTLPNKMPRSGTPLTCPHCNGQLQIAAAETTFATTPTVPTNAPVPAMLTRQQVVASVAQEHAHDEMVRSSDRPQTNGVDIVLGELRVEV